MASLDGTPAASPLLGAVEAGNAEEVRRLLGVGASLDERTSEGESLLHVACSHGDAETAEVLIAAGHRVDVKNPQLGDTRPLARAIHSGNMALANRLIASGADPAVVSGQRRNALHAVACSTAGDCGSMAAWLIDECGIDPTGVDDRGSQPIWIACTSGRLDVVEVLVERGVDVNVTDEKGWWPLFMATLCGGNAALVEYLLQRGARTDLTTAEGFTLAGAVNEAESQGHPEIGRVLAAHGGMKRRGWFSRSR